MSERIEEFEVDAEVVSEGPNTVTLSISVKDMPSLKLLVVELVALHDDMRVGASPFADRLGNALQRFGIDGEGEE